MCSSDLGRKLTTTDQREFGQLVSAIDANMARVLGGGYASSTAKGLLDAYKSQVAREGDSATVQALFLARFKQELNTFARNYQSYPGATPEMKAQVNAQNEELNKAIPWTIDDVMKASPTGKDKPTIGET